MASFLQARPACSALRKQSAALPLSRQSSSQFISSWGSTSSFSTVCSTSRLTSSPLLQRSNVSALPTQQTRTFLAHLSRQSQTLKEAAPSNAPPVNLQLHNLPYFIRRTASNQLPVYLVTKAGGTKQQTKIQKTEGDIDALRSDLAVYLGLEPVDARGSKSSDITINRLNGHIVVKGWRKPEIVRFLSERNF